MSKLHMSDFKEDGSFDIDKDKYLRGYNKLVTIICLFSHFDLHEKIYEMHSIN